MMDDYEVDGIVANQMFETAYKQRESYGKRARELTEVEVMALKSQVQV